MPTAKSPRKSAAPVKKVAPIAKVKSATDVAPPVVIPKSKLVRDSFTIPKAEYVVLESLKQRGASLSRFVKKSELLRAGIKALQAMNDKAFLLALDVVPSLKTGRPKGPEPKAEPGKPRK